MNGLVEPLEEIRGIFSVAPWRSPTNLHRNVRRGADSGFTQPVKAWHLSGDLFCAGMIWDSHYGVRYSCWYTLDDLRWACFVSNSIIAPYRRE